MSLLSKLFGSKEPVLKAETYQGFTITPKPLNEGGQFRLSALIEKDAQNHHLIRADTFTVADEAAEAAVIKAKQMIDQMGERLF